MSTRSPDTLWPCRWQRAHHFFSPKVTLASPHNLALSIIDDTLFIVLNAHYESTAFVLPAHRPKVRWELVLDTRGMLDKRRHRPLRGGEVYEMAARSLALFCRRRNHGNHVPRLA